MSNEKEFKKALEMLINKYCIDQDTSTPDFIFAEMIFGFIKSYRKAMNKNIKWHSGWEKE